MKKYISIISFLLLSFFFGFAQSIDCTIKFIDKENTDVLLYHILIDDSIYVSANFESILENNYDIYKFSINEGEHRISATMEGYSLIDTTLMISQTNNNFTLVIDMKNNFHLYEFKKDGYDKIFTKGYETIIGLKNDETFLRRSFFHISIVGCFQFERGTYLIDNNQLILNVDNYSSQCFKYDGKMEHQYIYTLEGDSILDIGKYNGYIEKKYMGINP